MDGRQVQEAGRSCDVDVLKTSCDMLESGLVVMDLIGSGQLHGKDWVPDGETPADSGARGSSVKVEYRANADNVLKTDTFEPVLVVADHIKMGEDFETRKDQTLDDSSAFRNSGKDRHRAYDSRTRNNCDISEPGVVIPDHINTRKDCTLGDSGSIGKLERRAEESRTDDESGSCSCGLQCPYCFFAIASVRLLRQHMVFHVAVSDAVRSPVFDLRLDCVDDGRMDHELLDEEMIQLCHGCRHIAMSKLASQSPDELSAVPLASFCTVANLSTSSVMLPSLASSSAVTGSPVPGLSDFDLLSHSELLSDKTTFLSKLSLSCVT